VSTELDDELHRENRDLGDVTKQTLRLVDLRGRAVEGNVVNLLEVLLGRLLKFLLKVDQPIDQLLLFRF